MPTSNQDAAASGTALSLTTPRGPSVARAHECLTFRLGAEEYAIDILKVQEIRGYEEPTRIANAPAFVKGVINLRGVIVPIVDLRLKFGLAKVDFDSQTVTVILDIGQRVLGVVVDSVSDVVDLKADQIRPAPQFGGAVDADHISGIGTLGEGAQRRMLILVDIERLMTSPEMGLVNEALLSP